MNDAILLIWILTYVILFVWFILFANLIFALFKKDTVRLKNGILYFVNTITFLVGIGFYLNLALIVLGVPHEKTIEASFSVLKHICLNYATSYLGFSLITTTCLTAFNFIYQKLLFSSINKKQLVIIGMLDLLVLVIASFAAIFHYYLGFGYEIYRYQK